MVVTTRFGKEEQEMGCVKGWKRWVGVKLPESRNVEDVCEAGPVHIQELNGAKTHRR